jgi:DNA-binding response OmpR family regulator
MKRILVACDSGRMDTPLRRSLAHLVKSCEIDVVHDGYAAFEEISAHPFDLLVFDFALSGIDSLELVESVQYIDPGVPVILLLQADHKSMRESAQLKAHPMMCPFKPLKFLRLVDKLLHQQLNRYRQLAGALETALETLRQQTGAHCVFLVEENGQLLLTKGELGAALVETLGNLVVGLVVLDEEMDQLFSQDETLHHHYHAAPKDHGLYVIPLTANLRLALLSPLTTDTPATASLWPALDSAAMNIRRAFDRYSQGAAAAAGPEAGGRYDIAPEEHLFIPLALESKFEGTTSEAPVVEIREDTEDEEEIAVNWQIITSASNLLSRLQSLSRDD